MHMIFSYFNSEITKYMLFSIYFICAAEAMLIISNFIRILYIVWVLRGVHFYANVTLFFIISYSNSVFILYDMPTVT